MKRKNIKEEIIEALEGKKILRCPLCNHSVFIRKEFTKVEVTDDGDGFTDKEIDVLFDEYVYRCAKCDEEFTKEELK